MTLSRFQRWAVSTTVATYLLIAVGGLVRAAGAGLGCPDWPKCFDRWLPPLDVSGVPSHIDPALFNFAKAWTEYVNRLFGVLVGILIFVTLLYAIIDHRKEKRILIPTVASFFLVGFQGWLGGQVVVTSLKPVVLTAHLVLALVIAGLLVYATVIAFVPGVSVLLDRKSRLMARVTIGLLFLVLLQTGLGALVRGEIQEIAKDMSVPRALWFSKVGFIKVVHQNFAVGVTAAIVLFAAKAQAWTDDRRILGLARIAASIVVLQVLSGLGLSRLDFPRLLQVLHLWLSTLLFAVLQIIALLAYRLDPAARSLSVSCALPTPDVESGASVRSSG